MRKRRSFIPTDPAASSLEGRLAPSSFTGWVDNTYRHVRDRIAPHHHNTNAAAGIQQLWNDSARLSKPHPAAAFQPAAHAPKGK